MAINAVYNNNNSKENELLQCYYVAIYEAGWLKSPPAPARYIAWRLQIVR